MQSFVEHRASQDEFDVILLSDFRFPGGTSQSNAEEIRAQAQLGLSTGLLQVRSPVLKKERPIAPAIQRCVEDGLAAFVSSRARARCKLLVVRHPTVLLHSRREMPSVDAERVVVVVNQPPVDHKRGGTCYDLARVQANAHRFFGTVGTWFPIGPLVRKAIEAEPRVLNLAPEDWHNIIDIDEWRVERASYVSDRPVIGRHSRDSPDKWPDSRDELALAYPGDGEFEVRILGGAERARELLGALPDSWTVLPFGTLSPREFLAGIDFFVYYHHPRWVESFGRTILEALASGAPAILPPHFDALFADAAIYAQPSEVRELVRDLYADRAGYEERSRRGVEFVEQRFSRGAHARRLDQIMNGQVPAAEGPSPRLWSRLSRALSRPAHLYASLRADSVYKIRIDLDRVVPGSSAVVRGTSLTTGKALFEVPIEGARRVGTYLTTEDQPERIRIDVEGDGERPVARRVRAERRADRPRTRRLELVDTSVSAAMATYPGRRDIAPAAIDSLVTQVDRLFVYLNNYEEVPPFIARHRHREKIVFILDPASERRAAAKFHWLGWMRGFHLLCDDDILYPPDYASRMVEAVERHRRRAIVGVHGVVFQTIVDDARASRRTVFKFGEPLAAPAPVHFLGSGTAALHSDVLAGMDLTPLHLYPIANDEVLAVSAKFAGVPMMCVTREAGWLKGHPGMRFGIFEERSMNRHEHDAATKLLADANPWPEPTGVPDP
jgi:glycosyltransferase involved in cell wall biosynthesis